MTLNGQMKKYSLLPRVGLKVHEFSTIKVLNIFGHLKFKRKGLSKEKIVQKFRWIGNQFRP